MLKSVEKSVYILHMGSITSDTHIGMLIRRNQNYDGASSLRCIEFIIMLSLFSKQFLNVYR
jgi:hypothetical protein